MRKGDWPVRIPGAPVGREALQVCQGDRVVVDLDDGRIMAPLYSGVVVAKVERGKWLVRLDDGRQVKVWKEDMRPTPMGGK